MVARLRSENPAMMMDMTQEDTIARACEQIQALHPASELLYASAVAWTLSELGIPSSATTADLAFEDSLDEGLRLFAFTVDGQPRDRHGNRGWEAISTHAVSLQPGFQGRPWFLVEGQDAACVMADEVNLQPGVQEKAQRLAGPVCAALQAQCLDQTTRQAPPGRTSPRL